MYAQHGAQSGGGARWPGTRSSLGSEKSGQVLHPSWGHLHTLPCLSSILPDNMMVQSRWQPCSPKPAARSRGATATMP